MLSLRRNRWIAFAILFACSTIVASFIAGYFWIQYTDLEGRIGGLLIYVDIGFDYGNGTRVFHNSTKTLTGVTLLDATKQVSNVTYQAGLFGTEVTAINGVAKQGSFGWTYWLWNSTSRSWSIVWAAADMYKVADGETFMWYYQNSFDPPP